jgi:hypothetical protein
MPSKGEAKYWMASILDVWIDSLLVEQRRHVAIAVEGRPERRNLK